MLRLGLPVKKSNMFEFSPGEEGRGRWVISTPGYFKLLDKKRERGLESEGEGGIERWG